MLVYFFINQSQILVLTSPVSTPDGSTCRQTTLTCKSPRKLELCLILVSEEDERRRGLLTDLSDQRLASAMYLLAQGHLSHLSKIPSHTCAFKTANACRLKARFFITGKPSTDFNFPYFPSMSYFPVIPDCSKSPCPMPASLFSHAVPLVWNTTPHSVLLPGKRLFL